MTRTYAQEFDTDKFVEFLRSGMTCTKAAKKLGVNRGVAYRRRVNDAKFGAACRAAMKVASAEIEGEVGDVIANLKLGMTLTAACEQAKYGRGRLQHYRRSHPKFNVQIKKLIAKTRLKPKPVSHISVTTKKQPLRVDRESWWEEWDVAARLGHLVETYPPREMA